MTRGPTFRSRANKAEQGEKLQERDISLSPFLLGSSWFRAGFELSTRNCESSCL